jgi:hypothetical protein
LQTAKEMEICKLFRDSSTKLLTQLKLLRQSEKEKQQLKVAQKAKGGRRASQEHKQMNSSGTKRNLLKPIIKITTYYHWMLAETHQQTPGGYPLD